MTTHHIYTATRYVLVTIKTEIDYETSWDDLSVLVFKTGDAKEATKPKTYEDLVKLLEDYDKVYDFYRVKLDNGEIGYDIILEG